MQGKNLATGTCAALAVFFTLVGAAHAASFLGAGSNTQGETVSINRVLLDTGSLYIDDGACEERGWIEIVDGTTIRTPDAPGTNMPTTILWPQIASGAPFYVVFANCGQAELTCRSHEGGHHGGSALTCTGKFWTRDSGDEVSVEYWLAE